MLWYSFGIRSCKLWEAILQIHSWVSPELFVGIWLIGRTTQKSICSGKMAYLPQNTNRGLKQSFVKRKIKNEFSFHCFISTITRFRTDYKCYYLL